MNSAETKINIRCIIEPYEELIYYKMDLIDDHKNIISTLEYSDITNILKYLIDVNEHIKLYNDINEICVDLAEAKLNRFCKKSISNEKIEELLNICAKYRHENSLCDNLCIHCNNETYTDPFPNFFTAAILEEID